MSRRTLLRVAVLAGSLFLAAKLTPQSSTLMSAEPADDPFAAPIEPAGSPIGLPTSPAELKILKALDEPTELDFIEEPLQGVVDYLSDRHKIQIVIDIRALDDLNIGKDEPTTHKLSGISLRSALDLVLRNLDLTWTIKSEVLLITTVDVADESCLVKVYDVSDLVVCQDEGGRLWDDYVSLIDTIESVVAPDTWLETVGGPGTVEGCTFASAKVLVILHTYQVHMEVAGLLDTIRAIAKTHGTDAEPPVRKKPLPEPAGVMGGFSGGGFGVTFGRGTGADSTTKQAPDAAEKPPK